MKEDNFLYVLEGRSWSKSDSGLRLIKLVLSVLRDSISVAGQSLVRDNSEDADKGLVSPLSAREKEILTSIVDLISLFLTHISSVTVVVELEHIDPSYRDMYYGHYARKFFDSNRNVVRFCFFMGKLNLHTLYMEKSESSRRGHDCCSIPTEDQEDKLSRRFMGSLVIGSFGGGYIGRTLIDPRFIVDKSVDVRLSRFPLNVLGRRLYVWAFPYRMQDREVMRCAEVTLLNLMCYYSNEYPDYHQVLPGEILDHERKYSSERVVPARGLGYDKMSRILSDFRFYPRLYNIDNYSQSLRIASSLTKRDMFQRTLHWYVSSGIPVAVNVAYPRTKASGHSLICIGYEEPRHISSTESSEECFVIDNKILAKSLRFSGFIESDSTLKSVQIVQSADFPRKFVVIDDGQLPYSLRDYDDLSSFSGMACTNYLVPLHRSMALDATDAYSNAINILGHQTLGLLGWGKDLIENDEVFVMSMFLTSVRGYKRSRMDHERIQGREQFVALYQQVSLPHFVWVVELSRADGYCRGKREVAIELVLDATNGAEGEAIDKIILMRYPDKVFFRDQMRRGHYYRVDSSEFEQMASYEDNLTRVIPQGFREMVSESV